MTEEQYLAALAEAPPLPACEFCGDTENLIEIPVKAAPVTCFRCACECQLQVYPEVVAFVGGVVARAAGRAAS